jgi:hypothetical protein
VLPARFPNLLVNGAGGIDEKVREAGRKHLRFALRSVVIGLEVDRVAIDVSEKEIRDLSESCFRVAHRRRRIRVHRAEIALAVDQRDAHRPVLGHPREGIVDRSVAVGVIFTHDVADDAAGLAIRPPRDIACFLAGEEDPAVDGLQAIANIWQRSADDDAHRIVEVGGLHLLDDRDWSNVAIAGRRRRWWGQIIVDGGLSGQETVL